MAKTKKPLVKSKEKPEGYVFGRPTIYKEEYCEMLIAHMASGMSFETFGSSIGVSRDRVYEWANKHPNFAEAKKIALIESQYFWEKQGVNGLWHGGKDGQNFNSSVWIFNMKNRFKWNDRVETTIAQTAPFMLAYNPYEESKEDA